MTGAVSAATGRRWQEPELPALGILPPPHHATLPLAELGLLPSAAHPDDWYTFPLCVCVYVYAYSMVGSCWSIQNGRSLALALMPPHCGGQGPGPSADNRGTRCPGAALDPASLEGMTGTISAAQAEG